MKGRREKASRVAWWMARVSCDLRRVERQAEGDGRPARFTRRDLDLVREFEISWGTVGRGSRSERKEKGEMRDERERRSEKEKASRVLLVGTSVMRERRDDREEEKASRVAWWIGTSVMRPCGGRAAGRRRRQAGPIHPQRSGSRSRIRDLVGQSGGAFESIRDSWKAFNICRVCINVMVGHLRALS
ncbi:hypothetical protein BSL78_10267 [Apostichopus japonicus]|uniref:Uncharacterized protein n=1 Tax=Stichopus japonicus TaxID=307972 RepID=A0A2G8KXU5_STIJA|nr:hypothetical protein BSL78_10267 [Apostichopus japonicus]